VFIFYFRRGKGGIMTKDEVLKELAQYGNEQTKNTFIRHGAQEPFYGVKVGDLKKLVKKIKKDHKLSLELFDTGNSDAMYLAGLIADELQISKEDLQNWVKGAYWYMISEYAVAWIASESRYGWELAIEWIDSDQEQIASAGWATLASLVSIKEDASLDIPELKKLLKRVEHDIHSSPNRVRYTMNGFVISLGSYVGELSNEAKKTAEIVGKVQVDMGGTACKVPGAMEYIQKVENMGRMGNKRKMARC
jgi:3-methyladenine DNA glycosylase AlkD